MAYAPRSNREAERIAWRVLGKPDNLQSRDTPRERELRNKIDYQVIVGGR
jgi:hypothetical protein